MGVSGPRTFQNDDAHIYLYLLMERLRKDIEDYFLAHEAGKVTLEEGNGTVMPAMDILITLSEHYGVKVNLDKVRVRNWKIIYLQFYDDRIDILSPIESYKRERRVVVEETFTHLEAVCLIDSDEDEDD